MKRHITLISQDAWGTLTECLQEIEEDEEVHEVIIQPAKSSLSANQRRLYWLWMSAISKALGYTKDELHLENKKEFLCPIFMRDDKDYAQMCESVRVVHRMGKPGHAKHLESQIVKLTSIMDASTTQMTEYLNDIQTKYQEQNIHLPIPQDIGRF